MAYHSWGTSMTGSSQYDFSDEESTRSNQGDHHHRYTGFGRRQFTPNFHIWYLDYKQKFLRSFEERGLKAGYKQDQLMRFVDEKWKEQLDGLSEKEYKDILRQDFEKDEKYQRMLCEKALEEERKDKERKREDSRWELMLKNQEKKDMLAHKDKERSDYYADKERQRAQASKENESNRRNQLESISAQMKEQQERDRIKYEHEGNMVKKMHEDREKDRDYQLKLRDKKASETRYQCEHQQKMLLTQSKAQLCLKVLENEKAKQKLDDELNRFRITCENEEAKRRHTTAITLAQIKDAQKRELETNKNAHEKELLKLKYNDQESERNTHAKAYKLALVEEREKRNHDRDILAMQNSHRAKEMQHEKDMWLEDGIKSLLSTPKAIVKTVGNVITLPLAAATSDPDAAMKAFKHTTD